MFIVYILRTSSNTLYIGQTNDLDRRLSEHRKKTAKGSKYMRSFSSFEIVHTEKYTTRTEAMKREYQLKQLSRKRKEELISLTKSSDNSIHYGASFSHPHLNYLAINTDEALKAFKSLNLPWIRLGCYWNEIEQIEGTFTFDKLDHIINLCTQANIEVLLTIGMKAPRWPEYYIPDWLIKKMSIKSDHQFSINDQQLYSPILRFIKECVTHFKQQNIIKVWQIENEPLDPSGAQNWRITPEFLYDEIRIAKQMDPGRKILVNLWGNELSKRKYLPTVIKLADIIGLDLYPRVPSPNIFSKNSYKGPKDSLQDLQEIGKKIKDLGKDLWITEIQTEPWENHALLEGQSTPPSFLPTHFIENLKYSEFLQPSHVFMWGFEWWYQQKVKGNSLYWSEVQKRFNFDFQ